MPDLTTKPSELTVPFTDLPDVLAAILDAGGEVPRMDWLPNGYRLGIVWK